MKSFGLVANRDKENSIEVAREIISYCKEHNIAVNVEEWIADKLNNKGIKKSFSHIIRSSDLILVLGGDGTILATAKKMKGSSKPLLGINLGGLGFLTAVKHEDIEKAMDSILENGLHVEKRMMISAHVFRGGREVESFDAANDVVVTKGALARMLNLEVFIDNKYLTNYTSDGLIVATPTGSTAHSLSAGGPIVYPDMPAMILTPICSHALGNRPLVMSDKKMIEIHIQSHYEDIYLTIDGQIGAKLKYKDIVKIKKSRDFIKLAMCKGSSYFGILREKLNWGGSVKK